MKHLSLIALLALTLAACGDEEGGGGGGDDAPSVASVRSCLEGLEGLDLEVQVNESPGDESDAIVTFEQGFLIGTIALHSDEMKARTGESAAKSLVEVSDGKAVRKGTSVVAFLRMPEGDNEEKVLGCV